MLPDTDPNLLSALEALNAEELRAFFLEYHECLEIPAKRSAFAEELCRFAATQSHSGWRPAAPDPEVFEEVRALVARSRRHSSVDPLEVDEFLRKGIVASMAGDHIGALLIFSTLLVPLFKCEIDVGQEEILSDALTVDLNDCGLRYILAMYLTAPPAIRAESVFEAVELVDEELFGLELISALEKLSPLPDLEAFLPRWREVLEKSGDRLGFRGSHYLREVVSRTEGLPRTEVDH